MSKRTKKILELKVCVRQLPPQLSSEDFQKTIAAFNPDIIEYYYSQGRVKEKEKELSRAYLVFKSEETRDKFLQSYKKAFIDEKGEQYVAVIEKAFYQEYSSKIKSQPNPLEGTYEENDEYKKFLEKLAAPKTPLVREDLNLERKANTSTAEKPKIEKSPIVLELEKKKEEALRKKEEARAKRKKDKAKKDKKEKGSKLTEIYVVKDKDAGANDVKVSKGSSKNDDRDYGKGDRDYGKGGRDGYKDGHKDSYKVITHKDSGKDSYKDNYKDNYKDSQKDSYKDNYKDKDYRGKDGGKDKYKVEYHSKDQKDSRKDEDKKPHGKRSENNKYSQPKIVYQVKKDT
eukprot:CAMPEP_0176417034 /NCGR_PEP_ID=MMETSP0127-20121128/6665_1 /TAXON_ID=938130 /ORGANISM="Platyophrya macrostoma, Strain WH" /LENGTH=342 /DNA_ID=CAMNT_0017797151 /DNA_START=17 /DNA_END=1045 /DNA_ORIENTATION=+